MNTRYESKSTPEEIRRRFDADVERFSRLETGQTACMDAPLAMELAVRAAVACTRPIHRVLDLGCGAGNYTLKLRQALGHDFAVDLLDLSRPMVNRAVERVSAVNQGEIHPIVGDVREVDLPDQRVDVILAAAVLHHLRDDADWERTFRNLHRTLRPGGGIWITDLVTHSTAGVRDMMWERYGAYLERLNGPAYREEVFAYIDREDSPRSLLFQIDLLRRVGFSQVEVLHKNSVFAVFGAIRNS